MLANDLLSGEEGLKFAMAQYRTIEVWEVGRLDVHLNFGYNEAVASDLFRVISALKAYFHLFLAYYSRPRL